MPEIIVGTREELAAVFTRRFEQAAAAAIAARGRFTIATAGGSACEALLQGLATAAVDWPRTHVFWCDERAVPPDDPESNYGAAVDVLFGRPAARGAILHRMRGEAGDLDAAARDYESALLDTIGNPPHLDLMLIGAGPDGHVCSLFPGHPALEERQRLVVAVRDSPKRPPERLTLTLPVLLAARSVYLGAFGADKAAIIRQIVEDPGSPLPAARALRGNGHAACLLDSAAAGLLSRG